jgi:hypothetical protein
MPRNLGGGVQAIIHLPAFMENAKIRVSMESEDG